jgi:ribosomal protein L11 methyltransferase
MRTKQEAKAARLYIRVTFITPAAMADEAAGILVANGALGCEVTPPPLTVRAGKGSPVGLNAYFERLSDPARQRITRTLTAAGMLIAPARPVAEQISDPGWATAWMSRFEPLAIGRRWLVVPPWRSRREPERIQIVIQPGQAFGTGHHPSTYGVLSLIEELCAERNFTTALDVGTGSGILAIAMKKMGVRDVMAIDIDPTALENARENAALNGLATAIRFSAVPLRSIRRKFDFITANILSSVLIDLKPRLLARLAPHGRLVLAGILNREAATVRVRYQPELRCVGSRVDGSWTALVMGT